MMAGCTFGLAAAAGFDGNGTKIATPE